MTDIIVEAIGVCIQSALGDLPVIFDNVEQNLDPPCCIIQLLENTYEPKLSGRVYHTRPFDILYFAPEESGIQQLHYVSQILMSALEWIQVSDGPLHGTSIRSEIVDGVLHVFVDYNIFTRKFHTEDPMAGIDFDGGIKIEK